MAIRVRSYAKINLGLRIGGVREDGFHELRTVYQTIALHDLVQVDTGRGVGIEIQCSDERVPADETNTCHRMAERVLKFAKARAKVTIHINKKLPMQGGLGAASSNAVATLLGMERLLKIDVPVEEKLRMAAEVGSDVPLFLIGGTVLGLGRGEEVYPLADCAALNCVVATAAGGISTPKAFRDWDEQFGENGGAGVRGKLTKAAPSATINEFHHSAFSWLCKEDLNGAANSASTSTGVSTRGGDRAEALLLDLVRAGIENDFERVVFPQHPEIREVKRVLEREGASYASLSGSGSSVFGFFSSKGAAEKAAQSLIDQGTPAQACMTLPRREYWKTVLGT